MPNIGTIGKLVIDGVSFDVMADAKASFKRAGFEIEGIATTGETLFKITKRVQTIEGVAIAGTPAKIESLQSKADSLADLTLSITFADGSTYKATGRIKFDTWESDTGEAVVDLIPKKTWTPFLA